jgi:phage/plasmid-like protein (TIGR03299 family)
MAFAGLDWEVETQPLTTPSGLLVPNQAVIRKDNGSCVGVVGNSYKPVQNKEVFSFFNDFITSGQAKFETAGSISGGKKVFVQAKIQADPIDITGRGDEVENYIMLGTSHDGSLSVQGGFFPIRLKCANQMATLTNRAVGKMIRFKHTSRVQENLEQVAAIMDLANREFVATADQFKFLASQSSLTEEKLKEYIKVVFAGDNYAKKEAEKEKEVSARVVNQVLELYEGGRGAMDTADSYWKAYNAVNEYICHERGSDDQKRLESVSFGAGAKLNQRALEVAIRLAA